MKKLCLILCSALFLLAVCGCTTKDGTDSDTAPLSAGIATSDLGIIPFQSDITDVFDFQCVCSLKDDRCFTINGENAKELYTVITDIYKQSAKTQFQASDGDYLNLTFQSGKADSEEIGDYYGCFSLFENDYLNYSGAPMISFAEDYKMPEGSYARLIDFVNKYA